MGWSDWIVITKTRDNQALRPWIGLAGYVWETDEPVYDNCSSAHLFLFGLPYDKNTSNTVRYSARQNYLMFIFSSICLLYKRKLYGNKDYVILLYRKSFESAKKTLSYRWLNGFFNNIIQIRLPKSSIVLAHYLWKVAPRVTQPNIAPFDHLGIQVIIFPMDSASVCHICLDSIICLLW